MDPSSPTVSKFKFTFPAVESSDAQSLVSSAKRRRFFLMEILRNRKKARTRKEKMYESKSLRKVIPYLSKSLLEPTDRGEGREAEGSTSSTSGVNPPTTYPDIISTLEKLRKRRDPREGAGAEGSTSSTSIVNPFTTFPQDLISWLESPENVLKPPDRREGTEDEGSTSSTSGVNPPTTFPQDSYWSESREQVLERTDRREGTEAEGSTSSTSGVNPPTTFPQDLNSYWSESREKVLEPTDHREGTETEGSTSSASGFNPPTMPPSWLESPEKVLEPTDRREGTEAEGSTSSTSGVNLPTMPPSWSESPEKVHEPTERREGTAAEGSTTSSTSGVNPPTTFPQDLISCLSESREKILEPTDRSEGTEAEGSTSSTSGVNLPSMPPSWSESSEKVHEPTDRREGTEAEGSTSSTSGVNPPTMLYLMENKTRSYASVPPDHDMLKGRLQLMLYRRLLSQLVAKSPLYDFNPLWEKLKIKSSSRIPKKILVKVNAVLKSTDSQSITLDDLVSSWYELVKEADVQGVNENLELVYRLRPSVKTQKGKAIATTRKGIKDTPDFWSKFLMTSSENSTAGPSNHMEVNATVTERPSEEEMRLQQVGQSTMPLAAQKLEGRSPGK